MLTVSTPTNPCLLLQFKRCDGVRSQQAVEPSVSALACIRMFVLCLVVADNADYCHVQPAGGLSINRATYQVAGLG
jgi:hypothetical protein